jgi:hypothetical protein
MSAPEIPTSASSPSQVEDPDDFQFAARAQGRNWKTVLKQPLTIAAFLLTLGVVGLILYLEGGSIYVERPEPEVSYELLANEGLTDGVPIAIKVNHVTVFRISDSMAGGGGANRAKEVQANLEAVIADLEEQPGRTITIDLDTAELPIIIQTKSDGSESRVLVELSPDDLILAGTEDAKWLARIWAERITDALKVFMFGEPPNFTQGTEFGAALTLMYDLAGSEGPVSKGSLDDAYEGLSEPSRLALAEFPVQEPAPGDEEDSQNP